MFVHPGATALKQLTGAMAWTGGQLAKGAKAVDASINWPASMPVFEGGISKSANGLSSNRKIMRAMLDYMRSRQDAERGMHIDAMELPADFSVRISMDEESAQQNYFLLRRLAAHAAAGRLEKKDKPAIGMTELRHIREHLHPDLGGPEQAHAFADAMGIGSEEIEQARQRIETACLEKHDLRPGFLNTYHTDRRHFESFLDNRFDLDSDRNEIRRAATLTEADIIVDISARKFAGNYGLTEEDCVAIARNPLISDEDIRLIATTEKAGLKGDILPTIFALLEEQGRVALGSHEDIDGICETLGKGVVKVDVHSSAHGEQEQDQVKAFGDMLQSMINSDPHLRMLLSTITAEKIHKHGEVSLVSLSGGATVSAVGDILWEDLVTPSVLNALGIHDQSIDALRKLSLQKKVTVIGINSAVNGLLEIPDSLFGLMGMDGGGDDDESEGNGYTAVLAGLATALGAAASNSLDYVEPKQGMADFSLKLGKFATEVIQAIASISAFPIKLRDIRTAELATIVEGGRQGITKPVDEACAREWHKRTVSNAPDQRTGNAVVAMTVFTATALYLLSFYTPETTHRKLKTALLGPAESTDSFMYDLALLYGLPLLNWLGSSVLNKTSAASAHISDETEKKFTMAFDAAGRPADENRFLPAEDNERASSSMLAQLGYAEVAVLAFVFGHLRRTMEVAGLVGEPEKNRIPYADKQPEVTGPRVAEVDEETPLLRD